MRTSWTYTPANDAPTRTIVVVGLARCGSSAVAGVLHHLGAHMGHRFFTESTGSYTNYEDRALCGLTVQCRWDRLRRLIAVWNRKHAVWGYKHWTLLRHLEAVLPLLRNPHVVSVWRDAVAIQTKQLDIRQEDPEEEWKQIASMTHRQLEVTDVLARQLVPVPHLLVSYERFLELPAVGVRELAAFAGLNPDEETFGRAAAFVARQPRNQEPAA
jgi:hypothetical protein